MVKEGDIVDVKVQSIDTDQQCIGLSMKALAARPMPVKKEEPEVEEKTPAPSSASAKGRSKGAWARVRAATNLGLKW